MELDVGDAVPNGIYCVDMEQDDFMQSFAPANIEDAIRAFRKMVKINVIRGVSFHDGIVPENPVAYQHIPIRVLEPECEEYEEIEVAVFKDHCFFLRSVVTDKSFALMDARAAVEDGESMDHINGMTPEIRIVASLHLMEIEEERLRQEMEQREFERQAEADRQQRLLAEPARAIRAALEFGGATVYSVKRSGNYFEALWECAGHRISTLVDRSLHVVQGGFCMSGYDDTQSARSIPRVLQRYVDQGDYIHLTRTPN